MPTIPTGKMERELRRLYMQWVHQLPKHEHDLHNYVAKFQRQSTELIERMGGDVARLGALADFPAPRRLDLSLHVGTIYSDMELAAISAQIGTGLNPTDTARALVRAGVDKSYRRLERLARTETVRAYWDNAWNSIDGLGMVMVWGAERGPRTCEWCLERDGMVLDGPDIKDHPNGRCTPIPMLPSQVEYRGSVRADGQIYQDPAWSERPSVTQTALPATAQELGNYGSEASRLADTYLEQRGDMRFHVDSSDELGKIYEYLGTTNTTPQLVPNLDDSVDKFYRGLSGDSAPAYLDQFVTGSHFPGRGTFGNGSYASTSYAKAFEDYAEGVASNVLEMAWASEAKVVHFDSIADFQSTVKSLLDGMGDVAKDMPSTIGVGELMALLGYDGYSVTVRDGTAHTVILNRSALKVVR